MKTIESLKELWVGRRIISISNGFQTNTDDNSLKRGTFIDVVPISKAQCPTPVIQYDDENDPVLSFSAILEYEEALWIALNKLTAVERWTLIQYFLYRFQAN
jgi:hypothetical protein